ncbi:MAG: hypothetical protein JWP05_2236 [Microbacteriaceae bacterium]|jgi:ZIP family zinc transporter|nr:hypothetical protein [Microbacteriaceae bacterium]
MSFGLTVLLGLIAGGTIVFGLPIGRIRGGGRDLRLALAGGTIGILVFLLWDVLAHAWGPIDIALSRHTLATLPLLGVLFLGGIAIGLFGIVLFERMLIRKRVEVPSAHHDGRRTALMIAIGIGLHNFAEGLAIGQSAATGAISLAVILVVGFALHNATEGFGIVAPMAGDAERPSWGRLLALGAIGGSPTIFGTAVGYVFVSDAVSVLFLSLAAGSILFVILQLAGVVARAKRGGLVTAMVFAGLVAGFVTDAVVTFGGA